MQDKLKEILKQLVVSAHREMGTEWCTKMMNEIDGLGTSAKTTQFKTCLNSTFEDSGTGNCKHCGLEKYTHRYNNHRCVNVMAARAKRTLKTHK